MILAITITLIMAAANKYVKQYKIIIYLAFAIIEGYFVLSCYFDYDLIVSSKVIMSLFSMGIL